MNKKFIINLLILVLILLPINVYAENDINSKSNVTFKYIKEEQKTLDNSPVVGSKAVFIAEPNTGKVIYEKNAHEKMYPASTTKILTALLTIEKCKMTDKVTISKRAIDLIPEGYSDAELQAGEEHTVKDLLYALLVPSANEAANALAEHISGSVEQFAEDCNKRAKELGCETLHFVNPNGIHDDNHYCSAYDLYLIAKECQKYDIFNEIVKTPTYNLPTTELYPYTRTLKNTNELILPGTYYYSYCTGIKTGYTTPAGECLVGSSSYNNINLISVVLDGKSTNSLGLNDRFYDTRNLFEFTYNNYSIKKIAEYGDVVATIVVGKATKETATVEAIVDTEISSIVPNEIDKEDIKPTLSLNENIIAPIEQNQVLGEIRYCADGLVYTTNVIASHSVEKLPYELYNAIVVTAIIIVFAIFTITLIFCKKYKKTIITIEIIIFIAICCIVAFYVSKDIKESVTKTTVAPNVTLNEIIL